VKDLPQRYSLVTQVADILRSEIQSGAYADVLPAESELAFRFHVSRPTIRSSLEVLRKDGLLHSARGQHHRIAAERVPSALPPATARVPEGVVILCFIRFDDLSPFSLVLINQTQQRLGNKYNVRVICKSNVRPLPGIKELVAGHPGSCWVLLGPPREVFRWFEASHLPCIAFAAGVTGAEMPVVDVDAKSIMLHAFALRRQRNYGNEYLLAHAEIKDKEQHNAFLAARHRFRGGEDHDAFTLFHDGTAGGLTRTLDRFVKAHLVKAEQPPLLLVLRPLYAMRTLLSLIERGYQPGKHFGLISVGAEPYLDWIVPSMARYSLNRHRVCHKYLKILIELVETGYSRPGVFRTIPDFQEGNSFPNRAGD